MPVSNRALSRYEALSLGVDTVDQSAPRALQRQRDESGLGRPIVGDTSAPAFEVPDRFEFQSYFDDTLGPRALLFGNSADQIIKSTQRQQQVGGYALGLHPSSEAPVGVRFFTGGQQGASNVYRLTPGQVIRPHGKPGQRSGSFSGFEYGLPFGWLGGGSVMLVVLRTPDAQVYWNSAPELIYHRMRLQIVAPASIPTNLTVVPNWPQRFPWPFAQVGSNAISQKGEPAIAVTPTKTLMRLRLATLAAPATMRAMLYGTNDFDLDSAGAIASTTISTAQDIVWGTWATLAGSVGVGTSQYQTQFFEDSLLTRAAADQGGALVLSSTAASLQSQYVDIVRYGRL